jgi:hypothetical protein
VEEPGFIETRLARMFFKDRNRYQMIPNIKSNVELKFRPSQCIQGLLKSPEKDFPWLLFYLHMKGFTASSSQKIL